MNQQDRKSSWDTERELLVSCATTFVDAQLAHETRELLGRGIDWALLFKLARAHQVEALIASNVCARYAESCPREVVEHCKAVLRDTTARNLLLSSELVKLVALFDANAVPVIPYKGALLAQSAYGGLGLRSFADLDVLVHPWDYHFRVPALLAARGWSIAAEYNFERTFENPHSGVHVDVHQALSPQGKIPFALDFDSVRKRCTAVRIMGTTVETFSPPDLLIVLCVQLAKDTGERDCPPVLIKLCDINQLIRSNPRLDWQCAIARARKLGVLRMLYVGTWAAAELLGTPLSSAIREQSRSVPRLELLARHIGERILNRADEAFSSPELLDEARWHFELRERLRDRYRPRWDILRCAVVPNDADFSYVRLPRSLAWLYYIVRPLRVAHKRGRFLLGRSRS